MANNDASFSLSSETARELEVFFDGAMEETKEKVLNVFSELARINSEAKYNKEIWISAAECRRSGAPP